MKDKRTLEHAVIHVPLADSYDLEDETEDERLLSERSYQAWLRAKAPRFPVEPPLPLPESPEDFLRRIRAQ